MTVPHCKLSAQKIGKISSLRILIEEKKTFRLMVLRVNKEPNGMSQNVPSYFALSCRRTIQKKLKITTDPFSSLCSIRH